MRASRNFIYCTMTLLGFGMLAVLAGPFPPIEDASQGQIENTAPYIYYPAESGLTISR